MTQPIRVTVPLEGCPGELGSLLAGDPERWLPTGSWSTGFGRWRAPVEVPDGVCEVEIVLSAGQRSGGVARRSLLWRPPAGSSVPSLGAELSVRTGQEGAEVVLDGVYGADEGRDGTRVSLTGDLLAATVVHRRAPWILGRFLTGLADRLACAGRVTV